jgi:hypothetical protein
MRHEPSENDSTPTGEVEAPEGVEEPFTAGEVSMMTWSARAGAAMQRTAKPTEE